MTKIRILLTVVAILGSVVTCGDNSRSTIDVRPRASLASETGLAGLIFRIGSRQFVANDFAADDHGLIEASTRLPNSGIVQFGLELQQGGVIVAQGGFMLEMRRNFEWGMDIFRQVNDPAEGCLGCMGVHRFPVDAAFQNEPGEAIWIIWGGRERGSADVF
jgi:hypothetical protein